MSIKRNKWIAMVIALILVVSMFAGCSSKKDPDSGGPATSSPTPASTDNSSKSGDTTSPEVDSSLASKDPMTYTVFMNLGEGRVYEESWEVFKAAAEKTNVSLKGTANPNVTDANQDFTVMMASGKISDIISASKDNFNKYGAEGAFLPLNDLIDSYAPNYKKFLQERPDVERFATSPDGKIYFIPFIPDGKAATGWFIRQDWLDKLSLKVPTTIDELHDTLTAFRNNDPNGNNKKDEVPFFNRGGWGPLDFAYLWGADSDFFVKDGKYYFGPYEPEYKTAMINLAQWYQEGLIDPEIYTRGSSARDILLGDNIGGMTKDWFGSTAGFNDRLQGNIPGFSFQPMLPAADMNGKVFEKSQRAVIRPNGWGLSAGIKNPEAAMRYFDFYWTEEGRQLMNFGIEGVTYDMKDGKPIFNAQILDGNVVENLNKFGAQIEIGFHQNFEYEKQWMNPIAAKGADMYINGDIFTEPVLDLSYNDEEQKIISNLEEALNTYVTETTQKWILGGEKVEAGWDNFISKLKAMGIEDLIKVRQSAYDRLTK